MYAIKQAIFILFSCLIFLITASTTFAHGVIESPASREQFCGVESKPDEIFRDKMTHEECRPMMTKEDGSMDNSVYNFMAVLTHATGRSNKPIDQLPKYVCGFASEMWSGGKTPWDKAINWPTSQIAAGQQKFVWNISWGPHFSDTDEFVFWITKPDFKFDPTKELTWNDFETTPFCHQKYNDQTPNANPNIQPDKPNNRFNITCNVPARSARAVIYAEWGRNQFTFERFHSCIDVVFSSIPNPGAPKAVISPIPTQVTGTTEIALDASGSTGTNLTYSWTLDAENLVPYKIENPTSAKTRLLIANTNAQQTVTVNLTVQQGQTSDRASRQFTHSPAVVGATWKTVGRATLDSTLAAGDKIRLRLIDNAGKDYFIPTTPIVLTTETAKPDTWAYTLAQAVNPSNQFSAKIGVLKADNTTIEPVKSATDNLIYVPVASVIMNGFIQVEKPQPVQPCVSQRKQGSSSYWLGYDVYADSAPIVLDFSATGIDLTKIMVDKGVFDKAQVLDKNKLLLPTKPAWVSKTNPGYLGFFGPNYGPYDPFNNPINATCQIGNAFKYLKSKVFHH